ncbi:hypothetical protein MTBBW1_1980008 [Desulfamplus magnetovallimortis]|uniref:Transposase n=1 Tax=Desulfamplus magnetovallimortis TaxID=1246637 RepID=A0A1W1HBH0_9BACT|nr:hypothetical protein MTBBW1_1980008 [Desulfamplus magnetovallimortis]
MNQIKTPINSYPGRRRTIITEIKQYKQTQEEAVNKTLPLKLQGHLIHIHLS